MGSQNHIGILYIVATPIGNLQDLTFRALETLRSADLIVAEDTRAAKVLFARFGIEKPVISYFAQSPQSKVQEIIGYIKNGKNIAYVSEAGTPGISDPGQKLVGAAVKEGVAAVPVPGASALTAALSVSGFGASRFSFFGFPPAKKGRNKFFNEVTAMPEVVIFYESPHRIVKTLKELEKSSESRMLMVARELTKKFETIYRGTAGGILAELKPEEIRGEFVIILDKMRK